MIENGWLICDHCRSSMDDPIEGIHGGEYCSGACLYAEEIDGPDAHEDGVAEVCPGCQPEVSG